ncbi:hypothetical protein [Mycobacterium shigaense]|uniref:hypothetical protein n=1 Tax=Mycobacterium shigaense TaxID=722731 RepID=UPI002AE02E54|nr:hypothetical protein [Mycobacterium shigaense]MEA1121706.1 hypothetical protein [Mycobacterium shigaense]
MSDSETEDIWPFEVAVGDEIYYPLAARWMIVIRIAKSTLGSNPGRRWFNRKRQEWLCYDFADEGDSFACLDDGKSRITRRIRA